MDRPNIQTIMNRLPEILPQILNIAESAAHFGERIAAMEANVHGATGPEAARGLLQRVESLEAENQDLRARVEALEAAATEKKAHK